MQEENVLKLYGRLHLDELQVVDILFILSYMS